MSGDRRGSLLLVAGAVLGALLAAFSLVRGDASATDSDDTDAVALVDGRPISRERFERALEAVAADRRGGTLRPGDRARVLERLVDEELLVGRAIELGLPATDPEVRADLVRSLVDSIEAGVSGEPPTEAELRRFHREQAWRFEGGARVRVAHAFFSESQPDAEGRARAATQTDILPSGDEGALPLPSGPLAARTLTQRLGPTAARGILELEIGATGGPWRARGGWHVARLLAREPGRLPPFEEIEEAVRAAHQRARSERALRVFLDERRESVEVVLGETG